MDDEYIEIKLKFLDGMLFGNGSKLVEYLSSHDHNVHFTRNPSMGRLNRGRSQKLSIICSRHDYDEFMMLCFYFFVISISIYHKP